MRKKYDGKFQLIDKLSKLHFTHCLLYHIFHLNFLSAGLHSITVHRTPDDRLIHTFMGSTDFQEWHVRQNRCRNLMHKIGIHLTGTAHNFQCLLYFQRTVAQPQPVPCFRFTAIPHRWRMITLRLNSPQKNSQLNCETKNRKF